MGTNSQGVEGHFTTEEGMDWYEIQDFDLLDPFLINVVTPDEQWIYVSSSGALTAGRRSPEFSLFPYETDDRLHRSSGLTGPITIIRLGDAVWQPFSPATPFDTVTRSVAKTTTGDRLRFTETNPALGLTFSYTWCSAGPFGLVRSCELSSANNSSVDVELLDGLVNILPSGVGLNVQQESSTLVDSYRRSELTPDSGIAIFSLEALISDRADPAESLSASVVWSLGLDNPVVVLSERQIRGFRSGRPLVPEHLVIGHKGAYLQSTAATITPDSPLRWMVLADVDQDHVALTKLQNRLSAAAISPSDVTEAIENSHQSLLEILTAADGRQLANDQRITAHHLANVCFNSMRGGVFLDDHRVDVNDVDAFIEARNREVHPRFKAVADNLEPVLQITELREATSHDPDLYRLVNEYLPLSFSRRHGDPSRPWNAFNIPRRNADGHPVRGYEGNWRDIFQNWEALMQTFPFYFESAISKFLCASTLDGNNPYRITHHGINWELPEEGVFSNFGYWGDHQIVYLHRLLTSAERFQPGRLASQLSDCSYSYADAPYRIRSYTSLVADPKETIDFDAEAHEAIERRVAALGADGRLVPRVGGGVHHGSLAEKLLVPAMAKLSNLVAGGGIWMNTQRPEWNDANNALVGNGVSMVTLFHLRDYLEFLDEVLEQATADAVSMDRTVLGWMVELDAAFRAHVRMTDPAAINATSRRLLLDDVGHAYETYRQKIYAEGPLGSELVSVNRLREFVATVMPHLDATAAVATRPDGLVHGYSLVDLSEAGKAELQPLYEMLEGQVAALGSSSTGLDAALELTHALFGSDLYRADQQSFVLYPNRPPVRFADKNKIPANAAGSVVTALADHDSDLISRDDNGILRFAPRVSSARVLATELEELEADPHLGPLVRAGRAEVLEAYETVFNHHAFTGRSQTMYKYEGLGSIYWHMVSKLLFALQEQIVDAVDSGETNSSVVGLLDQYRRVRSGLGYMKSPEQQGSFPTDPHSHTPAHAGAQQPGMTGQVKEGVLIRWGELGVRINNGTVEFRPLLLDSSEFLTEPRQWNLLGQEGVLEAGSLGFTYCGVPVIYRLVDTEAATVVFWASGDRTAGGSLLDVDTSQALFARTGAIDRIDVDVPTASLLA